MSFLEIKNINKQFNGVSVLSDINLNIEKSNFVSLVGLSGCGKTTLLKIIAGIESSDSGTIILDGKNITHKPIQQRNIGIVFQNYALFPHMNVFKNISYGLEIKHFTKKEIEFKVYEILEKVNLKNKATINVSLLSGGEQQRVAIARSIVTEPQVILLDEPMSNLDNSLKIQARNELKRLQNEIGITSILVTHDQSEALALSDTISILSNGRILQTGNPFDVYNQPKNIFTASFIAKYNIFDYLLSQKLFNKNIPENTFLLILPEDLVITKSASETDILVTDILFTGILTEYIILIGLHYYRSISLSNLYVDIKKGDYVLILVSDEKLKYIEDEETI